MRISDWSSDVCSSDLELHRRHLVDLALGHAHGQEHVALVGADRDLGVVDAEVDVAAVEVVVVELFQVAGELLTRVLVVAAVPAEPVALRSEEHTSELQSLMRISYAVFCLKKKKHT